MTARSPLPPELAGRSFSLAEASDLGVSARRLRASDLVAPTRGVRVPWGADLSPADVVRPLLEVVDGGTASFTTAARIWQLPLPAWLEEDFTIHITRTPGMSRSERPGVRCHRMRLDLDDVLSYRGLPITSPLRTWLDLAGILPRDELVAIGDYLVCSHPPDFPAPKESLFALNQMEAFLAAHRRVRGLPAARLALALVRVGADSVPETKLRLALLDAGYPEPTLNYVIRGSAGQPLAWPDQAFVEHRVGVQYDGEHHRSAKQQAMDNWRNRAVADEDWDQVIISAADVTQRGWDGVARVIGQRLERAIARRAA